MSPKSNPSAAQLNRQDPAARTGTSRPACRNNTSPRTTLVPTPAANQTRQQSPQQRRRSPRGRCRSPGRPCVQRPCPSWPAEPGDQRRRPRSADRAGQRRESLPQDLLARSWYALGGALLGVPVHRARSESMSTNTRLSAPGSSSACPHKATGSSRSTDSSWRACPKVNFRNNFPIVDGAYTPSNSVFIPPLRTASMSSMQSAPTHIPPPARAPICPSRLGGFIPAA
jgi:hypothetical protein